MAIHAGSLLAGRSWCATVGHRRRRAAACGNPDDPIADPRVIRFADPRPIRFGDLIRIQYAGPLHLVADIEAEHAGAAILGAAHLVAQDPAASPRTPLIRSPAPAPACHAVSARIRDRFLAAYATFRDIYCDPLGYDRWAGSSDLAIRSVGRALGRA